MKYNSFVNIEVKCVRPKYAKGEHQFTTLQDFLIWLAHIRSLPKGSIGRLLYGLVKSGFLSFHTVHYSIDVISDFHDYVLAGDIASRVGLLKTRLGSDSFSRNPEIALKFAEELDKLGTQ